MDIFASKASELSVFRAVKILTNGQREAVVQLKSLPCFQPYFYIHNV